MIWRRTPGATRATWFGPSSCSPVRGRQRQRPGQDDVDLLLAFVRVDPPALARREADEVQAERLHAELGAEALEAIAASVVETAVGDPVLHMAGQATGFNLAPPEYA